MPQKSFDGKPVKIFKWMLSTDRKINRETKFSSSKPESIPGPSQPRLCSTLTG
jgi:hypothetical protein